MSIPTLQELNILFSNDQECMNFLLRRGVFYETLDCPSCLQPMNRNIEKGVFRCSRRACGHRQLSIKKHTFFYGSCLKPMDILRLAHLWLSKMAYSSAILLTGHSPNTISKFYKHFRDLVTSSLDEEDQMIGGPGVIVEVDETKLGKRKYHRGHRVDGVWVLVGIERTEARKVFLVPVEDRTALTLTNLISKHVHPESILYTDCWKGYSSIQNNLGIEHHTVNHSLYFKDPVSGVCTNTVEGLNSGLKGRIPKRNRTKNEVDGFLAEYIWRRKHADKLWDALMEALKNIYL